MSASSSSTLVDSRPRTGSDLAPERASGAPSVAVVICTYSVTRWRVLCRAVASLRRQTRCPDEVVIVVDHCPALRNRIGAAFPSLLDEGRRLGAIRIVDNDGPQGLSSARNTGLRATECEVVAFLDDDASAEPHWLETLLAPYGEPTTVGVGGRVVPRFVRSRPSWFPPAFDWVIGCSHSGMPEVRAPVRNFVGANMSFRRRRLVEAGGFSSSLGRVGANAAGCEETELCIRAVAPGGSLVYEPGAEVRHLVPPSRTTWRYFLRRCHEEGRSKATVALLVGQDKALSDERRYLTGTIPRTLLECASEPHRLTSWARASAVVLGVIATSLGYLRGKLSRGNRRARALARAERADPGSRPRVGARSTTSIGRPVADRATLVGLLGLLVVVGLYAATLASHVAVGSMGSYGLISVLPATYWAGLAILTISFCWCVRARRTPTVLLALHVLLLIVYLHLTPTLLYGTLRYAWAWKHVGMTTYIIDAHHVALHSSSNPELVAYQDWPGFFALNAFLDSASGLATPLHYAAWAPAFNELLYAGPLMLIFRSFTTDPRVRWTALFLFYVGNWVGQDYFSPQGLAFFLYLVIIALYLNQLAQRRRAGSPAHAGSRQLLLAGPPGPSASIIRWTEEHERTLFVGLITLMVVAIASSHQLTPFMLLSATVLLVLARRLSPRILVVIVVIATFAWIYFAARTFLDQNLHSIITSIGNPLGNTTSSLINLQRASPSQVLVARIDRFLTAAIVALAVVGWWRSRNTLFAGRRWIPAVLLIVAPVVGLAANDYGGEMVFRVYLFALPMLALLGASAFVTAGARLGRGISNLARGVVLLALLAASLVAYYGKEQSNYFSPGEVQAMQRLFTSAPPGSTFISASSNLPWGFARFNSYKYYWYTSDTPQAVRHVLADPAGTLGDFMAKQRSAYLIFSSSDSAEVTMTGLLPPGGLAHIESTVLHSPRFRVVERSPGVTVVSLAAARTTP